MSIDAEESRWTGTAYLTDRFLVYVGPLGPTTLHSHHAVQIAMGLDGAICLRDADGRDGRGEAAVVPRDTAHAIVEPTKQALLLFVNPEDTSGRRVAALTVDERVGTWFDAGDPLRRLHVALPLDTAGELERAVQSVMRQFVGEAPRLANVHPAIQRLLSSLPSQLDRDVRLPTLAKSVGLSASRLGHLFTETVGIPLRPYILWLRMQRAVAEVRGGASLTTAAHAAGFTDSAHLSNVFRRMFGLSPSDITRHVRWILPDATATE
jgi:AraC-like DNA-binding protein